MKKFLVFIFVMQFFLCFSQDSDQSVQSTGDVPVVDASEKSDSVEALIESIKQMASDDKVLEAEEEQQSQEDNAVPETWEDMNIDQKLNYLLDLVYFKYFNEGNGGVLQNEESDADNSIYKLQQLKVEGQDSYTGFSITAEIIVFYKHTDQNFKMLKLVEKSLSAVIVEKIQKSFDVLVNEEIDNKLFLSEIVEQYAGNSVVSNIVMAWYMVEDNRDVQAELQESSEASEILDL
jgi:hypothetical protein